MRKIRVLIELLIEYYEPAPYFHGRSLEYSARRMTLRRLINLGGCHTARHRSDAR